MVPSKWIEGVNIEKLSRHNLAARVLAHQVCPDFEILEKDEYGKPYFESSNHKISISHAGEFAAFQLKENEDCGIDMEELTERIKRIATKFVRSDEEELMNLGLNGLYLIWCAKEAMYKYYGLKALDFKANMKVDFINVEGSGSFIGHIKKGDYYKRLVLDYSFFENYLMVNTQ